MATAHFPKIKRIACEGPKSKNPLAFKHDKPEEKITGKTGFPELEKLVLTRLGEPGQRSGRQEYLENLLNGYLHS